MNKIRDFKAARGHFGVSVVEFAERLDCHRQSIYDTLENPRISRRIDGAIDELIEKYHRDLRSTKKRRAA